MCGVNPMFNPGLVTDWCLDAEQAKQELSRVAREYRSEVMGCKPRGTKKPKPKRPRHR